MNGMNHERGTPGQPRAARRQWARTVVQVPLITDAASQTFLPKFQTDARIPRAGGKSHGE